MSSRCMLFVCLFGAFFHASQCADTYNVPERFEAEELDLEVRLTSPHVFDLIVIIVIQTKRHSRSERQQVMLFGGKRTVSLSCFFLSFFLSSDQQVWARIHFLSPAPLNTHLTADVTS